MLTLEKLYKLIIPNVLAICRLGKTREVSKKTMKLIGKILLSQSIGISLYDLCECFECATVEVCCVLRSVFQVKVGGNVSDALLELCEEIIVRQFDQRR